jgi:hypothetical protein
MSDFIETLRSVGGVKPCQYGCPISTGAVEYNKCCPDCHGTGQVIDFAPLLAKPKELGECASELWTKLACQHMAEMVTDRVLAHEMKVQPSEVSSVFPGNRFVVGPQRAHSLVYEVARQLGGTAVVAEPVQTIELEAGGTVDVPDDYGIRTTGYRLSLPIPPDATVLLATDMMDANGYQEMCKIVDLCAQQKSTLLPYILCLVNTEQTGEPMRLAPVKIISLHKEIK